MTKQFFTLIFGGSAEGYIEIRVLSQERKIIRRDFYLTTELQRLLSDITNQDSVLFKNSNVYFGVCPRREKKGKEENVARVTCLWIDIDCVNEKEREQKLNSLEQFDRPPSIIVDSGHGFHGYWLLEKPHEIRNKGDLLRLKGYVKGLTQALGGDSSFDLSRVLRVPGTQNTKNPRNPLPVKVLKMYPSRKYKLTDFQKLWVQAEEAAVSTDIILGEIPDRFWRILEENRKLRTTWKGERNDLNDGSRSAHDMALVNLLKLYNFNDGEVAAILTAAPYNEDKRLSRQYLSHTIAKAKTKKEEKSSIGKKSRANILEESPNSKKVPEIDAEKTELKDNVTVEPDALEEILVNYWETTGQKDELALGVAAYLCKLDWPWAMTRSLLSAAGNTAKDEEIDNRLRSLEIAYRRWQTGEPIAGSEKLRDILTASDLEKLEQLAKERRISKEVRIIDRIRCQPRTGQNGKPPFIVDREVCEAVVRDLKEKGRFLRVEGGQCYWFNDEERKVTAIDSQMIETVLDVKYGINPADRLMRNVIASLRTETLSQGEEVRVYRFSHYDIKNNVLYIYAGEGLVYKLNGRKILAVNNGSDGVFFEEMEKEASWIADLDNPKDPFQVLIKDLSFASGEGVLLAPRYQGTVFWLWLRSLFFEEIQPTKPILVLTGDHGSGKTTALRRVLYFLFGPRGEVSSVKDEQAWTPTITSNHLVVLDNVDKQLKWLPVKLDMAATGQSISIRVLYETNREYKVTPRCFLALTTVKPPFEEAPVVDRFILLKMKPLRTYMSERAMKGDVLSQRNQLWAGLLIQLNSDIKCLTAEGIKVDFRMADWAELCHKFLSQEKNGTGTFNAIIKGLKQEQSAQVLDYSIVPQILDKWEHDGGIWYSTADLYGTWKGIPEIEDLFLFKSPKGLGMHLSNIRKALHDVYGVNYRNNKRVWEYQFPTIRNKEE